MSRTPPPQLLLSLEPLYWKDPAWPRAVLRLVCGEWRTYHISHSRRKWRRFDGRQIYGVYLCRLGEDLHYTYPTLEEAQATIAPSALPKWLKVSKGL